MTAAEIAQRLNARKSGSGWEACCPAHQDRTASLSIGEGEDGTVLLHCHAGCSFADIVQAISVKPADLFPAKDGRPAPDPVKAGPKTMKTIHHDLDAAARAAVFSVEQRKGKKWRRTRTDAYCDPSGSNHGVEFRLDRADGAQNKNGKALKTFVPAHAVEGGWKIGDPAGKWHPYNAPGIAACQETIFICEGPKAAQAGTKIGMVCTTSSHGAQNPHKTDWVLLADHDVAILPDNDNSGRKYAQKVAALARKAGAMSVKIVDLPGLPFKGDLFEFIEDRDTQDPETIRDEIKALVQVAPEWQPERDAPNVETEGKPTGTGSEVAIRAKLWEIAQEKGLSANERNRAIGKTVVSWLHARGQFYHIAARPDFSGAMFFDGVRKLLLPIQGDAFLAWLADCLDINRAERSFDFVTSACETEALSKRSAGINPATYWAATRTAFYLSNGPGSMAKISAERVAMVDNGTDGVLFPYGCTLDPWTLTEPRDPAETCSLFREMSTSDAHGRLLFRLWLYSLPSDQRTKPPLCVAGTVGSGKTKAIGGAFDLYGIPPRITAVQKNGEGDFWIALDFGGLVCFDNVDIRNDWLADALAAAATGGTLEKRKLYNDHDRVVLRARSWVAVTSASPTFAADAGLADRLLVVRLNRREGETAEAALSDEIRRNRDSALSFICQTLSAALADTEPVPAGLNARHPDFSTLAVRIGRVIGKETEAIQAIRAAEADKSLFALENDWVGATMLEMLQDEPFTGTAGQMLDRLKAVDPSLDGRLSAKRLSKRITRLWPHLQAVFHARESRDGHAKQRCFALKPPSVAGIAGIGDPFSGNHPRKETMGSLQKIPSEYPQCPHRDSDPETAYELFDLAGASEQEAPT